MRLYLLKRFALETYSLSDIQPFISRCQFWLNRIILASILIAFLCSDSSIGQDVRGIAVLQIESQDNRPALTGARAFVNAASGGEEFGIGYVTFMLREGDEAIERIGAADLIEAENRIFYSFVEAPALRKLKTFLKIPTENQIRAHKIWFLFKKSGVNNPLRLRMRGSAESREAIVEVEECDKKKFERKYVKRWHQEFVDAMAAQRAVNDYPPILEDYLESMLLGRVALEKSQTRDGKEKNREQVKSLAKTVGLLLDLESTRGDLIAESMNPPESESTSQISLPRPIRLPVKSSTVSPRSLVVEEIAKVVPATCFYLRFGNWNNQIWLKDLIDEYGGDLSRMLTVRGYKKLVQSKFLDQLCVQSGPLDKWFGGTKVNDVALIGSDFYFRSGAGVGVVLQSQPNQTEALQKNFADKRSNIVKEARERILARVPKANGVTIDDIDNVWHGIVEINGRKVDFVETRTNRTDVENEDVLKATLDEEVFFRSFYVVEGDFHLITTSIEIVKQFLAIQDGKGISLGESEDFRAFRSKDPFKKGSQNRILFFASNSFLENLFKPGFQIELLRRNRLLAKIQVLEMATLAAKNEGVDFLKNENVFSKLVDGRFLPKNFGKQGLERIGENWVDQERGRFGFFKPLADVVTEFCTEAERDEYLGIESAVNNSIRALEPVYFHLDRRLDREDNKIEVVSIDSRITAIGEDDLDWALGRLGPKMQNEISRVAPIEEQANEGEPVVQLNLSLKKKPIFKQDFDYRLFLAVDDDRGFDPEVDLKAPSIVEQILAEVPGFVVTQPAAGVLNWFFPEGRRAAIVDQSVNREIRKSKLLRSPLYRLKVNDALSPDRLREVKGFNAVSYELERLKGLELKDIPIDVTDRTQFHLEIKSLAPESELNRWVNSINYRRSWQTSIANVKFMNFVSRQLGIDKRQVQSVCQDLLGVELVCSLGGRYDVVKTGGGLEIIFSDAWPDFETPVLPNSYQAPVLRWFRGCELRLSKEEDGGRFKLTGTVKVERTPTGFELPLFKNFKSLFGGGAK